MALGKVNSGDYRNGTPITAGHVFGTPVTLPEPRGNVEPQSNSSLNSNPVTWIPAPSYFGNTVDLSLQTVGPIVVVAPGGTGTTNINLTQLLGAPTPTLTYSGAPAGVTLAFAPNPDTGTSVCTVTVSSSVPVGKYTITIIGTVGTEINYTNLHLVVSGTGIQQIAYIGSGSNSVSSSASNVSLQITHTSASGNTMVLYAGSQSGTQGVVESVIDSNGTNWTFAAASSAGASRNELWYIVNSPSITHVTVTYTGGATGTAYAAGVSEFSGVKGVGTTNTSLGGTNAPTISQNITQNNDWIAAGFFQNATSVMSAGASGNFEFTSGGAGVEGAGDNTAALAGSSVTIALSSTSPNQWKGVSIELIV
jgi:hypothetical protein